LLSSYGRRRGYRCSRVSRAGRPRSRAADRRAGALAAIEERHADVWAKRLRDAREPVPALSVGWRTTLEAAALTCGLGAAIGGGVG
jgi:hypothetical protein